MGAGKPPGRPKGRKSGYTVSEKALAQRRNVSPMKDYSKPLENPDDIAYNSKQIEHILHIHEIAQHADRKDPQSLRACFINYLALCQQDGVRVGNLAAYASMGVTRDVIFTWNKGDKPEYRELAQFVQSTCALFRESLISDQKINPVIGIFWQRNFDHLRNDTEQIQSIQESTENQDDMTASDYRKKYGELLEE